MSGSFLINQSPDQPITAAKLLLRGIEGNFSSLSLRATDPDFVRGYRWKKQLLKILPNPPFSKEGAGLPPLEKGERGGFSPPSISAVS
jgi:hypothetical protein